MIDLNNFIIINNKKTFKKLYCKSSKYNFIRNKY